MKIFIMMLLTILAVGIFVGMVTLVLDELDDGQVGSSISWDGNKTTECHSVQVNHRNILGTYHYERYCEEVRNSEEKG